VTKFSYLDSSNFEKWIDANHLKPPEEPIYKTSKKSEITPTTGNTA